MTKKETNHFDVILEKVGDQPLKTTKILCEVLGFGLAKAKGMVDNAPVTIIYDIDSAKALGLKQQLEEAGNIVSVPGLEMAAEPITPVAEAKTNASVDDAFNAIFGSGAAQKATPPIVKRETAKTAKTELKITAKRNMAADNDAFDAIFGSVKTQKKSPGLRLLK